MQCTRNIHLKVAIDRHKYDNNVFSNYNFANINFCCFRSLVYTLHISGCTIELGWVGAWNQPIVMVFTKKIPYFCCIVGKPCMSCMICSLSLVNTAAVQSLWQRIQWNTCHLIINGFFGIQILPHSILVCMSKSDSCLI